MRRVISLILFSLLFFEVAAAEFHCQSAISYKWKRGETEFDVYRQLVVGVGIDEESAKNKLKEAVEAEKSISLAGCKQGHENLAGCIAAKFQSLGDTYQALGFSARKTMEDAISKDCENQQGLCVSASSTDAACVQRFEGAPSPTPEEGGDKKEEKGKAKGKKK